MTDEQIKEAADRLKQIDYHEREIADLERRIELHREEIKKERSRIDAMNANRCPDSHCEKPYGHLGPHEMKLRIRIRDL